MIKVKWDIEEAAVLFDAYFRNGGSLSLPKNEIARLSELLKVRAQHLGLIFDDKFRNLNGLNKQIGCIHYVVTEGKEGFSNASKLFYETYDLYRHDKASFDTIVSAFYQKYGNTDNE